MDHIHSEYLSSYISQGGSTVKFLVVDDQKNTSLNDLIEKECSGLGYYVIEIDSKESRLHMQQDIFLSFAKQIDWRLLTKKYLLSKAREISYNIDSIDPSDPNLMVSIAEANELEPSTVAMQLRPLIAKDVFRNPEYMSLAFRTAMTQLCLTEIISSNVTHYSAQPIIDWLTGINTRMSAVKHFQIYTPINRTTAKDFFESSLYWIKKVGGQGVFMILDNRRVTEPTNLKDGSIFYNRAMVMEHYEVLRKFIDSTEKLTSIFMLVLVNEEFVNPTLTRKSRGVNIYNALHTRILDDVRGKNQVNPNASLLMIH